MHALINGKSNARAVRMLGDAGARAVFCALSGGADGLFAADGGGVRGLATSHKGNCRTPALSPCRQYVVFSQDHAQGAGLCITEVDASSEALTMPGGADYAPVWSGDGKWLAWCRCPSMAMDDANKAEIWASPWPKFDPRQLTSNARMDCYPVFAPGGEEIFFESGLADGLFGLFSVTLDGRESPILYEPESSGNGIPHAAGGRIVFERAPAETPALYDVYTIERARTDVLVRHTFFERHVNPTPRFSPDGSLIVYHMPEGGDCHVHLIGSQGEEAPPKRVAVKGGWLCYPRFDSKGLLLACEDYRHENLRIARAASGETAPLSGPGPLRVTRFLELYNHDIA
ncbi:MAG: TolB family protein [Thermodesulfobacteriota bacterium]